VFGSAVGCNAAAVSLGHIRVGGDAWGGARVGAIGRRTLPVDAARAPVPSPASSPHCAGCTGTCWKM
jgi:hypothetical protein